MLGLDTHSNIIGEKICYWCTRLEVVASICTRKTPEAVLGWWVCWKCWYFKAPDHLLRCSFNVVIISNQGGISLKSDAKAPKAHLSKFTSFKSKVSAVFSQLDIPTTIYAATGKDIYRKPRTGMWEELLEDYDLRPHDLDLDNSIFVGDAAGREASSGQQKDFSCSDRYTLCVLHCVYYSKLKQKFCAQYRHQVLHPRGVFSWRTTTTFQTRIWSRRVYRAICSQGLVKHLCTF